ncbi:heat shock cognate 70 kDa protein-like protein [Tanacetum coccineum]
MISTISDRRSGNSGPSTYTYSCVAVWKNDQIDIVPNDQGNRTTPSCSAFTRADWLKPFVASDSSLGGDLSNLPYAKTF